MSGTLKICIDCKRELDEEMFNKSGGKLRPECKECEKVRREKRASANPYLTTLNKLSDNILKRTVYGIDKPKNRIYKERGIKCLLGSNRVEVREQLDSHFGNEIKALLAKGEKPSVDRIDPYLHYQVDNIQIVTLTENLKRIDKSSTQRKVTVTYPDGQTKEFPSVLVAAKELGCKRDTIYMGAERPGTNRKGLLFDIAN